MREGLRCSAWYRDTRWRDAHAAQLNAQLKQKIDAVQQREEAQT